MAKNTITYLVSDTPGWTVGTKIGNSAFLDPGDRIEADRVVDAVINGLEEGLAEYKGLGHLEQVDLDAEQSAAAERAAQLARVQGEEVLDEDETGEVDDETGMEPSGDEYNPREHKVEEVLDYLKGLDNAEEVDRIKALEAASDRGSTQIAAFEFTPPSS